jgi:hypothetical protein
MAAKKPGEAVEVEEKLWQEGGADEEGSREELAKKG